MHDKGPGNAPDVANELYDNDSVHHVSPRRAASTKSLVQRVVNPPAMTTTVSWAAELVGAGNVDYVATFSPSTRYPGLARGSY